jgi:hypothetical protein
METRRDMIAAAADSFLAATGRMPTNKDVVDATGLPPGTVGPVLTAWRARLHADAGMGRPRRGRPRLDARVPHPHAGQLASALRHSLSCLEADCAACEGFEALLEDGQIEDGAERVATALEHAAAVEAAARVVLEAGRPSWLQPGQRQELRVALARLQAALTSQPSLPLPGDVLEVLDARHRPEERRERAAVAVALCLSTPVPEVADAGGRKKTA